MDPLLLPDAFNRWLSGGGARPRRDGGGAVAAGLASTFSHCGRQGQAVGLAPTSEALDLLGEMAQKKLTKYSPNGGGYSRLERRCCAQGP